MSAGLSSETRSLWADRAAVAGAVESAPGLLLCLDFDGTLAPIVEDPDDAAMGPETRASLARLAEGRRVSPAVVSGRALADLRDRVGVDGVAYAGNHGMELSVGGQQFVDSAAAERRGPLDRVCQRLVERLAHVPGVTVENKGLTATVHVRRVPDDRVAEVRDVVRASVPRGDDGFEIGTGKAVFEVRPPVECDKGRAVELLDARTPREWLPVYVGDDVTDEDAFEAIDDGLAVVVGDREPTAADYRLPDRSDVREFLRFVDERVE